MAAGRTTLLVLMVASMPFASLALLPPESAAGMSILPQSMFVVILILKVLAPEVIAAISEIHDQFCGFRQLGCLVLFLLVGIVATVIMPRLFQGEVIIVPMRANKAADLLSPIQANFTQSGYMALSVMTTMAVTLMADDPGYAGILLTSILAGGLVCIATGLVDFAAASTGMESLLEPFRNAGYAFLVDVELAGVKRIVGLTPEASTYGALCVQFAAALALLRNLYAEGRQRILATIATIGLVLMAVLSTSSTAYAGLSVLGLAYAANWIRRAVMSSPSGRSGLLSELLVGVGLIVAFLVILIVRANMLDPLVNLINEVIFNKPNSSSFYERSYWNSVAWNAVNSTWGLGAGFGSTRTSNWFASVVSNTGLIGAALMGIFLAQTFSRRATWRTPLAVEMLPALKLSLLPPLLMLGISAPGADFGPWVGFLFGAIAGIAASRNTYGNFAAGAPMSVPGGKRATVGRAFGQIMRSKTTRGWRRARLDNPTWQPPT